MKRGLAAVQMETAPVVIDNRVILVTSLVILIRAFVVINSPYCFVFLLCDYFTAMAEILFKEESYAIVGRAMEVYNRLGPGFLEIVYKDALVVEFMDSQIPFRREVEYKVNYKGRVLPHKFFADFLVFEKIILEVKTARKIAPEHKAQALNYLKVSGCRLALILNFAEKELVYKRIVL